jgi:ABC-type nickel/cobalt efflux system permease component RcnA
MEMITNELSGINKTLEKMLVEMQKTKNKFSNALEVLVLIAGALGIFHTVEIIRQWIIGG